MRPWRTTRTTLSTIGTCRSAARSLPSSPKILLRPRSSRHRRSLLFSHTLLPSCSTHRGHCHNDPQKQRLQSGRCHRHCAHHRHHFRRRRHRHPPDAPHCSLNVCTARLTSAASQLCNAFSTHFGAVRPQRRGRRFSPFELRQIHLSNRRMPCRRRATPNRLSTVSRPWSRPPPRRLLPTPTSRRRLQRSPIELPTRPLPRNISPILRLRRVPGHQHRSCHGLRWTRWLEAARPPQTAPCCHRAPTLPPLPSPRPPSLPSALPPTVPLSPPQSLPRSLPPLPPSPPAARRPRPRCKCSWPLRAKCGGGAQLHPPRRPCLPHRRRLATLLQP